MTLNQLKKIICENHSPRYAYHCTNTNPKKIRQEGFKVGNDGFTETNMFDYLYEEYYPEIPVFVTNADQNIWSEDTKYVIKLDISGLDLYPDFGSLPDVGAQIDDFDNFFWENEDDIPNGKFKRFILNYFPSLSMPANEFTGEDSFKYLGSAVVSGKDLNKRIVDVMKNN